MSAYSVQLAEKQRVRAVYGMGERQFHNYYLQASKKPNTGEALLSLLESRLDNVVYRLGFAASRPQARLLVRHGHITVNSRRTNLPSYIVRPSQVIGVKDDKGLKAVRAVLANQDSLSGTWLTVDRDSVKGTVVRNPTAEDTKDMTANLQLIVELYSK